MTLTKRSKTYFNVAKNVSELSDFQRVHIGCCVVYKNRIISSACNSMKTNPLQKRLNKYRFDCDGFHSLHAETHALLPLLNKDNIDFKNVELYIYRRHKNGGLALAAPCPSCRALIKSLGIRSIYYTGEGSYIHEELVY